MSLDGDLLTEILEQTPEFPISKFVHNFGTYQKVHFFTIIIILYTSIIRSSKFGFSRLRGKDL